MPETLKILAAEPMFGAVREFLVKVHSEDECDGEFCPLHKPSEHPMRDWTKVIRLDKHGLIERVCEHGIGHPDPDSLAYYARTYPGEPRFEMLGVHGCDGCCTKEEE